MSTDPMLLLGVDGGGTTTTAILGTADGRVIGRGEAGPSNVKAVGVAAGLGALDAGSVGAYLHGLAGRYAADGAPAGAHDVAEAIPRAWRDVRD
jgi:NAD(P)H-hydrate repair Nnr-like enzyme with NAD(P)H-hydrate dehydratase domain